MILRPPLESLPYVLYGEWCYVIIAHELTTNWKDFSDTMWGENKITKNIPERRKQNII